MGVWSAATTRASRNRIGACTCGPAPWADLAVRVDRRRNLLVPSQVGAASRSAKRAEAFERGGFGFKTSIKNNSIKCFKRGLKPEIEQRLENARDMEHIVQNTIKTERLVDARKALRQEGKGKFENKENRRSTYLLQFHNSREISENSRTTNTHSSIICQYYSKPGHLANRCRQRISEINYVQVNCKLCNKEGHSASQCRNLSRCQLCDKQGHVTKQCHFQSNTCQICNKAGHVASRCFQSNSTANRTTAQLEARSQLTGQICSRIEHTAATCRINMDKSCAYCKNNGHTIENCR